MGGLFNQGLLQKAVQKDYQEETAKQKDYQEEAAVSSKIGTDYNFSNDGCKIWLIHLSSYQHKKA